MRYKVSFQNPSQHYIDVSCTIDNIEADQIKIQLPSWRPGRYELGNFAKNIQHWQVLDNKGGIVKSQKINKDKWLVETSGIDSITIQYNYYAAELNAGSTWLDETQIYINPVNCFVYQPEKIEQPCTLELIVPNNYTLATGLLHSKAEVNNENKSYLLNASNYHELVDSPLISSANLLHNMFVLDGVEFHVWFQGECKPDWAKIVGDFFIFINEHFVLYKEFPKDNYHFLIQVLPFQFYHGVEHHNSTVIAIGPSYALMQKDLYNELLGVSSHELFHTWNVKQIRPKEMLPYNYTHENYARTGYIYEGVTTYYGDMLLYRSGIFKDEEYFKTLTQQIQKHYDNPGRLNMSVADSSFDTWLDGYVPGVPNRKTSIYTEGCLLAFMTDILIRKYTSDKKSLDDVMRTLYVDFGKKNIGYTAHDYQTILENITGNEWNNFFNDYVNGTKPYQKLLKECMTYLGLELSVIAAKRPYESFLGFKTIEQANETFVSAVYPNSSASQSGLSLKDKIVMVNGFEVKNNLTEWCNYFWNEPIQLAVITDNKMRNINLKPGKELYYKTFWVIKNNDALATQQQSYTAWCGRKF